MNKLSKTLNDINLVAEKHNVRYLLTRFNPYSKKIDDLDILVKENQFKKIVNGLVNIAYVSSSHDFALGGRVKGAQINLTKMNRIKIDLHKDFTWRRKRYFDLDYVWKNNKYTRLNNILAPSLEVDTFLILVNVLFEKMYLNKFDYQYLRSNLNLVNDTYVSQAKKYDWTKSYNGFAKWWNSQSAESRKFPVFLPYNLVLVTFIEKFEFISFAYYNFFVLRYLINRTLPYE